MIITENITGGYITEDITEDITENITENITEDISEDITENIRENITEDITEDIAENILRWWTLATRVFLRLFCVIFLGGDKALCGGGSADWWKNYDAVLCIHQLQEPLK